MSVPHKYLINTIEYDLKNSMKINYLLDYSKALFENNLEDLSIKEWIKDKKEIQNLFNVSNSENIQYEGDQEKINNADYLNEIDKVYYF